MYNIYSKLVDNPGRCERLTCKGALFTIYNCALTNKFEDLWSHHNYIVYVAEGRKIWHTAHGSYDLCKGSCVFVRKGANIVEQFFDTEFCFFVFFMPDDFLYDALRSKTSPIHSSGENFETVITIHNSFSVEAFFQSMLPYFDRGSRPDASLLELKFKELILMVADNPLNGELLSYFRSLLKQPQSLSLQRVMEENFCFNLSLEDLARLSARSLSGFKRDFERFYHTSPGKWIMEKRLTHAWHLLLHMDKTVAETAFECGFENPSHFSRAFRRRHGVSPGSIKRSDPQPVTA